MSFNIPKTYFNFHRQSHFHSILKIYREYVPSSAYGYRIKNSFLKVKYMYVCIVYYRQYISRLQYKFSTLKNFPHID